MAAQSRSRVVFVGNLPFDVTEDMLTEVFSSVGPVVSFRYAASLDDSVLGVTLS